MDWSDRIGRRIKLRDLHVLLAVAQSGSMARAADNLSVSRQVVSKAISDLEHAVGARLLQRDRSGAEATPSGAALLKRALAAFDELREGVKDIEVLSDPTAGEVRIGCNPALATGFVSAVVDRMSRRWARMRFEIVARPGEFLLAELSGRNVDLLVARKLGALAVGGLAFEMLFDDQDVVAAGAGHPLVRRGRVALSDLMNERWVLPPRGNIVGSVAMDVFHRRNLGYPSAAVLSDSPHVRMGLVSTGRFLSIFPASALRFSPAREALRMVRVEPPLARVAVGIVTLPSRALGAAARLFVEEARKLANEETRRLADAAGQTTVPTTPRRRPA